MSFMFNPYPYKDMNAINRVSISPENAQSIRSGNAAVCAELKRIITSGITLIDGHIGVDFEALINELRGVSDKVKFIDISACYKSPEELDKKFAEHLPIDLEMDPISLFGRMFEGEMCELINLQSVNALKSSLKHAEGAIVIYGCGSAIAELRDVASHTIYCDMSPMNIVLRAKNGQVKCIGDSEARPFKNLMRHLYYVDYEVCIHHRQELLSHDLTDYYIDCNESNDLKLAPRAAFNEIFHALVEQPFRCKPCYIEGVWGGDYIKNLRSLPDTMRNCAWVFDLIPNEVSLMTEINGTLMEFPFITFYRRMGVELMGKETVDKYLGVFPIRFNYDDTYHGGNMSIQVHPPLKYNHEHFSEPFQQDESYYCVFTAGSRTYMGFKDDADVDEFYRAVMQSEKDGSSVDYERYVNSVVSRQGRQFLIPGGTIHSSGANQVVLEIGSWTVGSYTFKMYDYLRTDLDGARRPIHSRHGANVIDKSRREDYVNEQLVPTPKLLRADANGAEYIIGEHENMFFQLRCLEFHREMEDNTTGKFHVLNLVEGQRVRIEALSDPAKSYEISYLDMAVIPACIGAYRIVNLGAGPVRIHKTLIRG